MAASYPSSAKTFTTKVSSDVIEASHVNDLQLEVTAVESALLTGLAHNLLFVDDTYDIGASGATRPRHLYLSQNAVIGGTLSLTGNMVSDLKFTDATYDIGKSGATRPRDGFFSRNVAIGGTLEVTGVGTFTAAAVFTGGLSIPDSAAATFGTGSDATIKYDGTNLLINPQVVGSGATVLSAGDFYTTAWTDYSGTSIVSGWSGTPTVSIHYKKIGRMVFVNYSITGTSNSTGASFTLPFATQTQLNMPCGFAADNGSPLTTPAALVMNASSSTVNLYKDMAQNNWTAASTKTVKGQYFYEATS